MVSVYDSSLSMSTFISSRFYEINIIKTIKIGTSFVNCNEALLFFRMPWAIFPTRLRLRHTIRLISYYNELQLLRSNLDGF